MASTSLGSVSSPGAVPAAPGHSVVSDPSISPGDDAITAPPPFAHVVVGHRSEQRTFGGTRRVQSRAGEGRLTVQHRQGVLALVGRQQPQPAPRRRRWPCPRSWYLPPTAGTEAIVGSLEQCCTHHPRHAWRTGIAGLGRAPSQRKRGRAGRHHRRAWLAWGGDVGTDTSWRRTAAGLGELRAWSSRPARWDRRSRPPPSS